MCKGMGGESSVYKPEIRLVGAQGKLDLSKVKCKFLLLMHKSDHLELKRENPSGKVKLLRLSVKCKYSPFICYASSPRLSTTAREKQRRNYLNSAVLLSQF